MAGRAFICIVRNDIPAGVMQVTDLLPNTSQRNLIYDPKGQTGYLNPANLSNNSAITALVASDPDGAGGNDYNSTGADEYGLQAYLRERVNVNPGLDDDSMTPAEAATVADAIVDRMASGLSITLADINAILNANLTGADNDLEGTAGDSFGTVEDILRILAGEAYKVRANTVVELTAGPVFQSLAQREAAIGANTANFFASGLFVDSTDSGYLPFLKLYDTGALKISAGEGILSKLKSTTYSLINPLFTYGGGSNPAQTLASTPVNIPTSGEAAAVVLYDSDGNII